ncbi:unnamed protein product [Clonostachys solani]|uniref:ASST-domain-containing protein n=1 Tax=Clonostachys solani TaxID=160281 RepID=A0A9N9W773_9HYPO|nr:unnamed protein product [Clonostachys solani]
MASPILSAFAITGLGLLASVAADETSESWPYQVFKSRPDLQPPVLEITKTGATAEGYLFFTQTGSTAHNYSTLIMTDDGELVYSSQIGAYTNFKPQPYKGEEVLTYFHGITYGEPWGMGYGIVQVRDKNYESITNVTVEEGITVLGFVEPDDGWLSYIDMHESQLTSDGTMLVTAYNNTRTDLSSVGGLEDGYVLDGVFYEIDVESNEVIFEWRATDHEDEILYRDALKYYPLEDLGQNSSYPWGPFHINSVEKFKDGSYLVSSRFYCSIFKIGTDGSVQWQLDGQSGGDFELANGLAFAYQHDARIHSEEDGTYLISLLDNAWSSVDNEHNGLTNTTGMYLSVNENTKVATLVQKFVDPEDGVIARSQANMQVLPNKNVFLGYGFSPKMKEFDSDGNVVMRVKFGEPYEVQMYRAFRFPWVGTPSAPPDVFACHSDNQTQVYMSWNGATEHQAWSVLAGDSPENLQSAGEARRTGFETMIAVPGQRPFVQAVAQGRSIEAGHSEVVAVSSQC